MSEIEAGSVLEPTDVMWRKVAGEVVILNAEGSRILGLNGTGGRVWELIDGARSVAEIAALVAGENARPVDSVVADVLAFARSLLDRQLARVRGQG